MLEFVNLTKKFGDFAAVEQLNMKINKGDLYGFLGPNGAGKTTTIKMIAGLLSPTSGSIFLDSKNLWENLIESKTKIGYIPDQPYLYDKLTGKEYLYFCGGLYNIDKKRLSKKIDEVTALLNIGDWLNKRTEEYSQGMRQRIVIASSLLHEPEIIIVDEPMIGLDPQSAFLVKKIFKEYAKNGITIFMSTHSLNVVEEICSHVGIINNGHLIFNDTIESLVQLKSGKNNNLEELFIQLTNE